MELFRLKKNPARWRQHDRFRLLIYPSDGAGRFGYENGELVGRKGDIGIACAKDPQ